MMATTHSDIILQHINNMLSLSGREDAAEISQNLKYIPNDLLRAEQIKVYQLKCGKNGFAIPTFNDVLDSIIEEAYSIQE
ncbi:MAG: hypothetical protein HFH15_01965 [Ruminococcus sp.]|nr:hypothetical protein [Ruminococcus sp.]